MVDGINICHALKHHRQDGCRNHPEQGDIKEFPRWRFSLENDFPEPCPKRLLVFGGIRLVW